MPRVTRTRKEREGFLIKEFLNELGYRVSREKWTERPDAIVTISKEDFQQRIGIEHTDYFNDAKPGDQSPVTPIVEFWELVQRSLAHRISHLPQLVGLESRVRFNIRLNLKDPKNPIAEAREFAKALVDFAKTHPVRPSQQPCIFRTPDFLQSPVLRSKLTSIQLWRPRGTSGKFSRVHWTCSNASTGFMGLSANNVATAVSKKNKKARNYDKNGANELWLLIAATGDTPSSSAGPLSESDKLNGLKLLDNCNSSPFDRIIFWERVRGWYKWLKPHTTAVQYKDQ